uniref:F-box domain-containing protein n=1 Tax=Oryza rufipogon TaxID=4529 RepID=A0A0E0PSJ4_ORYRU
MARRKGKDLISQLPDDILLHILSMPCEPPRWKHLHTKLPALSFIMSVLGAQGSSLSTQSRQRVDSMARTLRRRCAGPDRDTVKRLCLAYRKDVPMECRYADEFIALAAASSLGLFLNCPKNLRNDDAGPWSLHLPAATACLSMESCWYSVRPPHVHGPGASALKSLTFKDSFMVLHPGYLQDTAFPSLEELHISGCTLSGSIEITSATMPRLKHLRIADVSVVSLGTAAAIAVLADELTTLRVSCHDGGKPDPPSSHEMLCVETLFRASFTEYSCFRLRSPKLRVFEWRCCYAKEVRVDAVGRHLSDVVIELFAGRLPRCYNEAKRFLQMEDCDKLMNDILQGIMPGRWKYVQRKFVDKCIGGPHINRLSSDNQSRSTWIGYVGAADCSTVAQAVVAAQIATTAAAYHIGGRETRNFIERDELRLRCEITEDDMPADRARRERMRPGGQRRGRRGNEAVTGWARRRRAERYSIVTAGGSTSARLRRPDAARTSGSAHEDEPDDEGGGAGAEEEEGAGSFSYKFKQN